MRSLILCLLAFSSAFAFPAEVDNSKGGCPGGYAEGAEIERGRLIYICQGGQVVAKGCIAEDLSRITVGSKYDNSKYRRECKLGGDGQLSFEATACLQNGQEHKSGETWEDGANQYTCKQNADGTLSTVNAGCVDGGKKLNPKDQVVRDDTLFECQEGVNGKYKLVPVGCVKDGKQYKAGDSFEVGNYWFNCTRTGREKVVAKPAGCVSDGRRLNDGDRFNNGDVFKECRIDEGKTAVVTVACAQKDGSSVVERRLGCTWTEGTAPFQYEWECKHDPATDTAVKVQVRCNYAVGGGVYQIAPGCYRTVENNNVAGCVKESASLKLQSFQGDKAEQSAQGAGLHAC